MFGSIGSKKLFEVRELHYFTGSSPPSPSGNTSTSSGNSSNDSSSSSSNTSSSSSGGRPGSRDYGESPSQQTQQQTQQDITTTPTAQSITNLAPSSQSWTRDPTTGVVQTTFGGVTFSSSGGDWSASDSQSGTQISGISRSLSERELQNIINEVRVQHTEKQLSATEQALAQTNTHLDKMIQEKKLQESIKGNDQTQVTEAYMQQDQQYSSVKDDQKILKDRRDRLHRFKTELEVEKQLSYMEGYERDVSGIQNYPAMDIDLNQTPATMTHQSATEKALDTNQQGTILDPNLTLTDVSQDVPTGRSMPKWWATRRAFDSGTETGIPSILPEIKVAEAIQSDITPFASEYTDQVTTQGAMQGPVNPFQQYDDYTTPDGTVIDRYDDDGNIKAIYQTEDGTLPQEDYWNLASMSPGQPNYGKGFLGVLDEDLPPRTSNIIKGATPEEQARVDAIYRQQDFTKIVNKEQQKMFWDMRGAGSARESLEIRAAAMEKNPLVGSYATEWSPESPKGKKVGGVLGAPAFIKQVPGAEQDPLAPEGMQRSYVYTDDWREGKEGQTVKIYSDFSYVDDQDVIRAETVSKDPWREEFGSALVQGPLQPPIPPTAGSIEYLLGSSRDSIQPDKPVDGTVPTYSSGLIPGVPGMLQPAVLLAMAPPENPLVPKDKQATTGERTTVFQRVIDDEEVKTFTIDGKTYAIEGQYKTGGNIFEQFGAGATSWMLNLGFTAEDIGKYGLDSEKYGKTQSTVIDLIFDMYTKPFESKEYETFLASKKLEEDDYLGGAAVALEYMGTQDYARQYGVEQGKAQQEILNAPAYYAGSGVSEVLSFFIPATKAGYVRPFSKAMTGILSGIIKTTTPAKTSVGQVSSTGQVLTKATTVTPRPEITAEATKRGLVYKLDEYFKAKADPVLAAVKKEYKTSYDELYGTMFLAPKAVKDETATFVPSIVKMKSGFDKAKGLSTSDNLELVTKASKPSVTRLAEGYKGFGKGDQSISPGVGTKYLWRKKPPTQKPTGDDWAMKGSPYYSGEGVRILRQNWLRAPSRHLGDGPVLPFKRPEQYMSIGAKESPTNIFWDFYRVKGEIVAMAFRKSDKGVLEATPVLSQQLVKTLKPEIGLKVSGEAKTITAKPRFLSKFTKKKTPTQFALLQAMKESPKHSDMPGHIIAKYGSKDVATVEYKAYDLIEPRGIVGDKSVDLTKTLVELMTGSKLVPKAFGQKGSYEEVLLEGTESFSTETMKRMGIRPVSLEEAKRYGFEPPRVEATSVRTPSSSELLERAALIAEQKGLKAVKGSDTEVVGAGPFKAEAEEQYEVISQAWMWTKPNLDDAFVDATVTGLAKRTIKESDLEGIIIPSEKIRPSLDWFLTPTEASRRGSGISIIDPSKVGDSGMGWVRSIIEDPNYIQNVKIFKQRLPEYKKADITDLPVTPADEVAYLRSRQFTQSYKEGDVLMGGDKTLGSTIWKIKAVGAEGQIKDAEGRVNLIEKFVLLQEKADKIRIDITASPKIASSVDPVIAEIAIGSRINLEKQLSGIEKAIKMTKIQIVERDILKQRVWAGFQPGKLKTLHFGDDSIDVVDEDDVAAYLPELRKLLGYSDDTGKEIPGTLKTQLDKTVENIKAQNKKVEAMRRMLRMGTTRGEGDPDWDSPFFAGAKQQIETGLGRKLTPVEEKAFDEADALRLSIDKIEFSPEVTKLMSEMEIATISIGSSVKSLKDVYWQTFLRPKAYESTVSELYTVRPSQQTMIDTVGQYLDLKNVPESYLPFTLKLEAGGFVPDVLKKGQEKQLFTKYILTLSMKQAHMKYASRAVDENVERLKVVGPVEPLTKKEAELMLRYEQIMKQKEKKAFEKYGLLYPGQDFKIRTAEDITKATKFGDNVNRMFNDLVKEVENAGESRGTYFAQITSKRWVDDVSVSKVFQYEGYEKVKLSFVEQTAQTSHQKMKDLRYQVMTADDNRWRATESLRKLEDVATVEFGVSGKSFFDDLSLMSKAGITPDDAVYLSGLKKKQWERVLPKELWFQFGLFAEAGTTTPGKSAKLFRDTLAQLQTNKKWNKFKDAYIASSKRVEETTAIHDELQKNYKASGYKNIQDANWEMKNAQALYQKIVSVIGDWTPKPKSSWSEIQNIKVPGSTYWRSPYVSRMEPGPPINPKAMEESNEGTLTIAGLLQKLEITSAQMSRYSEQTAPMYEKIGILQKKYDLPRTATDILEGNILKAREQANELVATKYKLEDTIKVKESQYKEIMNELLDTERVPLNLPQEIGTQISYDLRTLLDPDKGPALLRYLGGDKTKSKSYLEKMGIKFPKIRTSFEGKDDKTYPAFTITKFLVAPSKYLDAGIEGAREAGTKLLTLPQLKGVFGKDSVSALFRDLFSKDKRGDALESVKAHLYGRKQVQTERTQEAYQREYDKLEDAINALDIKFETTLSPKQQQTIQKKMNVLYSAKRVEDLQSFGRDAIESLKQRGISTLDDTTKIKFAKEQFGDVSMNINWRLTGETISTVKTGSKLTKYWKFEYGRDSYKLVKTKAWYQEYDAALKEFTENTPGYKTMWDRDMMENLSKQYDPKKVLEAFRPWKPGDGKPPTAPTGGGQQQTIQPPSFKGKKPDTVTETKKPTTGKSVPQPPSGAYNTVGYVPSVTPWYWGVAEGARSFGEWRGTDTLGLPNALEIPVVQTPQPMPTAESAQTGILVGTEIGVSPQVDILSGLRIGLLPKTVTLDLTRVGESIIETPIQESMIKLTPHMITPMIPIQTPLLKEVTVQPLRPRLPWGLIPPVIPPVFPWTTRKKPKKQKTRKKKKKKIWWDVPDSPFKPFSEKEYRVFTGAEPGYIKIIEKARFGEYGVGRGWFDPKKTKIAKDPI